MTIDNKLNSPPPFTQSQTTAIGSLPHHNVDAALAYSFQLSVPFLPQIPIRNPWEFMIPQALEGMPGLSVERDGMPTLDPSVWAGRARYLDERLALAFERTEQLDAFSSFEPSASTSSSWQPFLFELEERGLKFAKAQIAGPLTAQWSLRMKDSSRPDDHPRMTTQVFRLVLARSIAMVRRLKSAGVTPLFYLDEPGLYGFTLAQPRYAVALQELKLMVHSLQKEGALVGLHCCSNTDWKSMLGIGLNFLSLDTELSLDAVCEEQEALHQFAQSGGRLSLGIIPSPKSAQPSAFDFPDAETLLNRVMQTLRSKLKVDPGLARSLLSQAILTPACGLALHSTDQAEEVLGLLLEISRLAQKL